jgi:threonine dehydratase
MSRPVGIRASSMIERSDIAQTERLIRPHIRRTPVIEVDAADFGPDAAWLSFKLELLQHAGSFKTRGAFANLLTREIPEAGVVAASGGNHRVAVAYTSMKLGISAKIFVLTISSPAKTQRNRDYRAELVVTGDRHADALAASEVWAQQSGALSIHAYAQRETLLGQGTIGLEIEEQSPDIDTLLVAVGGGGLIAGIASCFAGKVRMAGVEPEASPTFRWRQSWRTGRCTGWRYRRGFTCATPGRDSRLPHRQPACGPRGPRRRRREQACSGGSLGHFEGSCRTWRCRRPCSTSFGSLSAAIRRARRGSPER